MNETTISTKQLLSDLNGHKNGELKRFIDNFEGEPRIAWYPSAGQDFRALLYLHPRYPEVHPSDGSDPQPPDIFLYTDYFPWQHSTFLDSTTIYADGNTTVEIVHIEWLPELNLPLHPEVVDFREGSIATGRTVFLKIKVSSNRLGDIYYPVIYAFAENEAFYCSKLVPNNASISHIIHVRYGGGCGGGGKASGVWLLNVLKKLNCELFITDGHHHWQQGDKFALELCSSIPAESDAVLTPIRVVRSENWSGHGDVRWNLVS